MQFIDKSFVENYFDWIILGPFIITGIWYVIKQMEFFNILKKKKIDNSLYPISKDDSDYPFSLFSREAFNLASNQIWKNYEDKEIQSAAVSMRKSIYIIFISQLITFIIVISLFVIYDF